VIKTFFTCSLCYRLDLNYDFAKPNDLSRKGNSYSVYGVAVSEVEIDCLTGDHSVIDGCITWLYLAFV